MEKRGTSHSAPYGHACLSCFKAKCRCVPRPEGVGCERCHRLKKHCVPSNSVRRRAVDQKHESNDRTARLEDFLEGLRSVNPLFGEPPTASAITTCLDTFRSHMLPHFPFIHLPASLTAREVCHDRPFLFSAIACVASPTPQEKRTRAAELKRMLSETAILQQWQENDNELRPNNTDQRIDFLLGLLTYTAWGWDLQLCSRLMMLAISLVGEMRLDKPASTDVHTMAFFTPGVEGWGGHGSEHMATQRLYDRQRAVLACFVLSSAISDCLGQINALRWTPMMEEGLAAISAGTTDCPTDAVLALQVRLQLLATEAIQMRDQGQRIDQTSAEALLVRLQELRLTIQHHQEILLTAQIHSTELSILEAIQSATPTIPAGTVTACPPVGTHPSDTSPPAIDIPNGLANLWQSVLAIQSCSSALLTLCPSDFRGIAFPQWAQLTRCIVALHRLETLPVPDPRCWNTASIRAVVDLSVILERMIATLQLAAREANEEGPEDVFTRLAAGDGESGFDDHRHAGEEGGEGLLIPDAAAEGGIAAPEGVFCESEVLAESVFHGPGGLHRHPKPRSRAQIPTAMSIIIFCQNMGGAVSLVAANAIFSNTLRSQLRQRAAEIGVAPDVIVNAGARSVRQLVWGPQLAVVLQAYSKSVDTVMYLGIAVSVAAFGSAWGLGWKDIRVGIECYSDSGVGVV
ncbi:hypothetical protein C8A00DRAFT_46850 [Chaetomidium leptoderma]|uniref:Zn(2)-C6 fungal-type domain-containing protein n=1 Tax=Chaetomidium leptoderma TaxID=669021 RepID=A0AAN6ZRW1_9PEZI|nr:hypothetical protein C8A00DRAFT_46850 [Chaetomidium leptoderma]